MKNITTTLLILLNSFFFVQAKKVAKITGFIGNSIDSVSAIKLTVIDAANILNHDTEYDVKTINGKFSFSFAIDHPVHVYIAVNGVRILYYPEWIGNLLIDPGDDLNLTIKDKNKLGLYQIEFKGIGSKKMDLVKLIYPAVKAHYRGNIRDFVYDMTIEDKFRQATAIYNSVDSVINANPNLVSKENSALIRARSLEWTFSGLFGLLSIQDPNSSKIKTLLNGLIAKVDFRKIFCSDKTVINLTDRSFVIKSYALAIYAFQTGTNISDLPKHDPIKYFSIISEFYKSTPWLRDFLLSDILVSYFQSKGIDQNVSELVRIYSSQVNHRSDYYRMVLKELGDFKQNLGKGKPFMNFALLSSTGNKIKLSDLKGNVVVLDFYFTGCLPCQETSPFITEIEKQFQGKQVKFISISIDKDRSTWEKGRGIYSSPSSIQLYTNGEGRYHDLIKFAQIDAYPRLMLLDQDGNLITIKAPDPRGDNGAKLISAIKNALMGAKL